MPVDDQNTEFCGILKDYTQDYIEVLNVVELKKIMVTSESDNSEVNKWLHVSINGSGIDVSNISEWPIYIESIHLNNKTENLNRILPVEGKHHLENLEFPKSDSQIVSRLIIPESLDLVVPRRTSFIRHGCPRYKHTIETLLGRSSSHTVQEAMQTQFTRLINARKFSDQNES
ncbi:hypothetical protein K8T06_16065 [bacterium]|nr:hypothetical protein [bacterium]